MELGARGLDLVENIFRQLGRRALGLEGHGRTSFLYDRATQSEVTIRGHIRLERPSVLVIGTLGGVGGGVEYPLLHFIWALFVVSSPLHPEGPLWHVRNP